MPKCYVSNFGKPWATERDRTWNGHQSTSTHIIQSCRDSRLLDDRASTASAAFSCKARALRSKISSGSVQKVPIGGLGIYRADILQMYLEWQLLGRSLNVSPD
jgi:hypothetical protein